MATLQVIGAGCGRTGTASLKAALEQLGFAPCYHMFEVVRHGHEERWEAALTSPETADWHSMFNGFKATVDFPAATAYVELMAAFPDAKIVLSVRDAPGWAKSVMDTIWSPYAGELSWVQWPFRRSFQRMTRLMRARFFEDEDGGLTSGKVADEKALAAQFDAWNAKVVATVPKERLLIFRASDGWGPLCAFLGVPEPSEPYPRVNDTAAFKAMTNRRWWQMASIEACVLVAAVGVTRIVIRCSRS